MNSVSIFSAATALLISTAATAQLPAPPAVPATSTAKEIVIRSNDPRLQPAADEFFATRLGSDATLEEIRDTVQTFYRGTALRQAEIYEEKNAEGATRYVIQLNSGIRVRHISVSNNVYFSRSAIFAAMHLSPEAVMYLTHTEEYRLAVKQLYADAGFPDAEVKVETTPIDAFNVDVHVDVRENSPSTLRSIDIHGEIAPFTADEIREMLEAKVGQHYDTKQIKQRIDGLRNAYVERGYLAAQLAVGESAREADSKTLALVVEINRGPHMNIRFLTPKYFFLDRDSILKETIGLEGETRFSKGFLEEAAQKLRDYYQSAGYAAVNVQFSDVIDSTGENRNIDFFIEKGERVKISSLQFRLGGGVKRSTITSFMSEFNVGDHYNLIAFRKRAQDMKTYLQQLGYHDAGEPLVDEQFSKDNRFVELTLSLGGQRRYYFGTTAIEVDGKITVKKVRQLLAYKRGKPFVISAYEKSLQRIRNYCRNTGYKYCEVTQSLSPGEKPNIKNVAIKVTAGDRVRIGTIFVLGNKVTEERVIRRELRFDSGDLYSPNDIEESQRSIQRLGFFSGVQIDELDYDAERKLVDLLVKVREKKQGNIRFRVGYGTDEGARITSDVSYLNIAGTGRNVYLSTGLSHEIPGDILEYRIIATYIEPRLFSTPFNGRLQFGSQRQEEEFGNLDLTSFFAGIEYTRLLWIQNLLKWEIEFREPFDLKIPSTQLNPFDQTRRLFGSIGDIVTLDLRDNPFNPTYGYLGQIQSSYYSEAFLSEEEFYQVFSRNSFYLPIYKLVSLVLSVRFGFAGTLGTTADAGIQEIPIEKRFRLGGGQTLRGFSLDSVGGQPQGQPALTTDQPAPGGNSVFNYMAEIDLPMPGGFQLAIFHDGGNAYVTNEDFDPTDIRTSAGIGLRYLTPIGPVRLDYGFKLDRRLGESIGEFHFAVGLF